MSVVAIARSLLFILLMRFVPCLRSCLSHMLKSLYSHSVYIMLFGVIVTRLTMFFNVLRILLFSFLYSFLVSVMSLSRYSMAGNRTCFIIYLHCLSVIFSMSWFWLLCRFWM